VNIERTRVKDSVNVVWWLSKSDSPKANNRNVLQAYSPSMVNLLRNGYTPKLRPSGHDISSTFQRNNGGSIPPNLLSFANTSSNSHYLRHCRELGLKPHPARFPAELPSFFIRFLTEVGDTVFDPFAGSLTTGYVAATLARRWICAEQDPDYVQSGMTRFWDRMSVRGPGEFEVRRRLEPVVPNWIQRVNRSLPTFVAV
jgi:site-specific DNA-methyltransferase (cytosine-N4-specific)